MKKILFFAILLMLGITLSAQVVVQISTTTNVTCYGACNGSVTATAFGGTPPYAYLWNNFSTVPSPTGLCPGTYTITVTDNMGVTGTATATINQPPQMQLTMSSTNACGISCIGTASAAITGGTPAYFYLWSTGMSAATATNLCTGTYSVTVMDSNGCMVSQNVTVNQTPSTITDIIFDYNPAFCGSPVGAAWINSVSGGTSPYTYIWSNAAIGQTITNLSAGTYSVTAIDANGCGYSENIIIPDSLGFTLALDSISDANCANNQLGYLGISITGGQGPFGISWSNGETQTTYIDSLLQGIYEVTVFDSTSWCIQTLIDTINSTYNLYASVQNQPANCSANGWASVQVLGVNPPFTYYWNDPMTQTDSLATGLVGGNYNVTVTDNIGCTITASTHLDDLCRTIIKGRVFNDVNQNCIQDSGETGIENKIVRELLLNNYAMTDINGDFTLTTINTSTDIFISNTNSGYNFVCPTVNSLPVSVANLGDTSLGNNFAVYLFPGSFDLYIHPGWTTAHPGFSKRYWFLYNYSGSAPINATVNFNYDPVLQFDSCTNGGVPDLINHTITWTFNNLQPGSYWNWNARPSAYFTVPVGTSIYDSLDTYFEILPIAGDHCIGNNTLYVSEPVTGSHDPNDKQVYPRGEGANGCILPEDSVLFYTIRFQNDGNDTAFTVVVVDTLSPYVNPATFVPGASSHPYTVSMTGDGIITFRFDQIMLPDSGRDLAGSQGSLNFTVNLDAGLPWNTVIANRAAIFFDFNEAVITNTVINTLCEPLTVNLKEELIASVFPNPATDFISFTVSEKNWDLRIYDICGKEIISKTVSGAYKYNMALPENMKGVYLYEIKSDRRSAFGKLIIE